MNQALDAHLSDVGLLASCLKVPSLVVYEVFSPTQPGEEQNFEGLREPSGHPKRTILCTRGQGMTIYISLQSSLT